MGWMPRPVSWLKAIPVFGIGGAIIGIFVLFGKHTNLVDFINTYPGAFFVIIPIALLFPFIGYAYIHSWLIGQKPDKWAKNIPAPNSIKEACLSYVVMFFSVLAAILTTSPFAPPPLKSIGYHSLADLERFGLGVTFTWCGITIYMFHGYDIITKALNYKSVDKPKTEAPKSKVDPVDLELNRLKHQNGQMINQPTKKDS